MLSINFEFVGGPNDGKVLRGSLGDASDAERYYLFTNHGHVGQRFKVASDFAVEALVQEHTNEDEERHNFQPHYYVVTERLEENEEVLVRAAYLDKDAEQAFKNSLREPVNLAAVEVESSEEKIHRYLKQTATVMGQSYGSCWPADAPEHQQAAELNISLHFAHVLLNEHFSVFAKASHADDALPPVDLLGIAPGQDWFLACQFRRMYDVGQIGDMLQDVNLLETFWLNRRIAIDACGGHVSRVAEHCEVGYGLAAGLHRIPGSSRGTDLLEHWMSRQAGSQAFDGLVDKLNSLDATWLAPISARHYPGHGSYCLLAALFRIPKPTKPSGRHG